MNLRSDSSTWPTPRPLPAPALNHNTAADIVIIGSGISGALAAYYLTQTAGRSVVMLDKRDLTRGSIAASTALLQYEIDTTLVDLSAKVGRRNAERAYQLCLEAIGHFDEITTDLGHGQPGCCGYQRRQSLFLAGNDANAADLLAEHQARRLAGIHVRYLDRSTLKAEYGIDRAAALLSEDAAEVDPVCLTHRLLERSIEQGLTIHGHTAVTKYDPTPAGVTLTTSTGHTVQAARVVFCTGYETEEFLGQSYVKLEDTFAVVSEPVKSFDGWRDRCLIWEAQTPYFYCRTTADNRIIIGGEDEPLMAPKIRDASLPAKTAKLVEKFKTMFPAIDFRPAKSWAGTFAESHDGLPYIGQHPRFPNGYFSLGYGGNGITFALLAARLLRDDLDGRPNQDAALFAFDRAQTASPLVTSG
ncbi:MAG: Glycine/D-amino acid oxidase [Phycisphaerales bacterium]|nr:Glycine/D-amino acid oxidase [Phycisphaerales bacterium]